MRNCLKQKYCNISLEDIEEAEFTNDAEHETLHVKQHLHIQTMTYQFTKSIDQDKLYEWLSNLPDSIYRVKRFCEISWGQISSLIPILVRSTDFTGTRLRFPNELSSNRGRAR